MDWDVFISHAWEDKESFVRPLAEALIARGLRVWYDEFTITVGDSLRRSIDRGLANSRYGVVVLSPSFFAKEWPQKELDGLAAREVNGEKVILPIWHQVTASQVREYSPILADRMAVSTTRDLDYIVAELIRAMRLISDAPDSGHTRDAEAINHIAALFSQLVQAEAQHDWDAVVELGERILKLDANHQPTRSKTAQAYHSRGADYYDAIQEYDAAILEYSRAIELEPSWWHYADRGYSYYLKGDYRNAIKDCARAIAIDPSASFDTYYCRGMSFKAIGNLQAARYDLRRAADMGHSDAQWEIARL